MANLSFSLFEEATSPKGERSWRDADSTLLLPRYYAQSRSIQSDPNGSSNFNIRAWFKCQDADGEILRNYAAAGIYLKVPNRAVSEFVTGDGTGELGVHGVWPRFLEILNSDQMTAAIPDLAFLFGASGYTPQ
jgi:hypothetical protein